MLSIIQSLFSYRRVEGVEGRLGLKPTGKNAVKELVGSTFSYARYHILPLHSRSGPILNMLH